MSEIPVREGSEEQFTRVRKAFEEGGFTEEFCLQRNPDKADLAFRLFENAIVPESSPAADVWMGLFLSSASVSTEQITNAGGPTVFQDLQELGLIAKTGDRWKSTVRIRPMEGLYILSDFWKTTSEKVEGDKLQADVVFPPDIGNTTTYLSYVPTTPCDRFLEACGGSGVAALLAARSHAKMAYSFDLMERATAFASFSGKLNAVKNFEARVGDSFAPANGETYDAIAAHPPYVPVLRPTYVFHGGGPDGEMILRKHIEGLPDVLSPGGEFVCRTLGADRVDQTFEQRIRQFLGEKHNEFDVFLHVLRVLEPLHFVIQSVVRGYCEREEVSEWDRVFTEMKLRQFVASVVVIRRHDTPQEPVTLRRLRGEFSGPAQLQWWVNWEIKKAKLGTNLILDSKLTAGEMRLYLIHSPGDGRWEMERHQIHTLHPYPLTWESDALAAYLIPKCDGNITTRQLYQGLVDEGAISGNIDPHRFASVIGELISGGFIIMEGHEPPVKKEHKEAEE